MVDFLGPAPNLHQGPFNLEYGKRAALCHPRAPTKAGLSAKRLLYAYPSPNIKLSLPFDKARPASADMQQGNNEHRLRE